MPPRNWDWPTCWAIEDQVSAELAPREFHALRALVRANTGIVLPASKLELVKRRYAPRLKALGLAGFRDYLVYLDRHFDSECAHFCAAITTNLTAFHREPQHFHLLADTMLPALLQQPRRKGLRLWSAGCATGQEAWSLALTLLQAVPDLQRRNVKILATDIDASCLATARQGSYPARECRQLPPAVLQRYFRREPAGEVATYTVGEQLRRLVSFRHLNLVGPWPMRGDFDVIFCRNVFIYFDPATRLQLVREFARHQQPGSYLCLGHAEFMPEPAQAGYRLIGRTAYLRVAEGSP